MEQPTEPHRHVDMIQSNNWVKYAKPMVYGSMWMQLMLDPHGLYLSTGKKSKD